MKQKISLTPSDDNTIYVEDVKVEEGIYIIRKERDQEPGFIVDSYGELIAHYAAKDADIEKYNSDDLPKLIDAFTKNGCKFYHIPTGHRIVTEKPLTVADLKNSDLIGLIRKSVKYFVVTAGNGVFAAIKSDYSNTWNGINATKTMCIPNDCDVVYRFTTAQELHKWLGEDEV